MLVGFGVPDVEEQFVHWAVGTLILWLNRTHSLKDGQHTTLTKAACEWPWCPSHNKSSVGKIQQRTTHWKKYDSFYLVLWGLTDGDWLLDREGCLERCWSDTSEPLFCYLSIHKTLTSDFLEFVKWKCGSFFTAEVQKPLTHCSNLHLFSKHDLCLGTLSVQPNLLLIYLYSTKYVLKDWQQQLRRKCPNYILISYLGYHTWNMSLTSLIFYDEVIVLIPFFIYLMSYLKTVFMMSLLFYKLFVFHLLCLLF